MKNIINTACVFLALFFCGSIYAQHIPQSDRIQPFTSLTLDDKVNKSDAVVEGRVINETRADGFFLDPNSRRVFTSVIIKVSRVFKGDIKDTTIELVIDGGTFPSGQFKGVEESSALGWLSRDEEGIFFLRSNNTNIQSGKSIQSFFYLYAKSIMIYGIGVPPRYPFAHDGAKKYDSLDKDLYPAFESITGTKAKVIGLNSFETSAANKK
jgi:hypothetical protein